MADRNLLAQPARWIDRVRRKAFGGGRVNPFGFWEAGVGVLSLGLIGLLWFYSLQRGRQELEQQTEAAVQKANSLTRVFEAQTAKTLKNIDLALEIITRDYLAGGKSFQLTRLLASRLIDERMSKELAVVDERGQMVLSVTPIPNSDMTDREYFTTLRGSSSRDLYVGRPIQSRTTGKWIIPVARRIVGHQGEFKGVVVCGVAPASFIDFYRREELNANGAVTLLGTDGFTRARRTGAGDSFGEDIHRGPLFAMFQEKPAGDFIGTTTPGNVDRFQSYAKVGDYELIASVGLSVDESLADVREKLRGYRYLVIFGTAYVLAFGAAIIVVSVRRRLEQEEAQIQQLQSQAILDNIVEVAWFKDVQSRFLAINQAFVEMCGRKMAEIIGKTDADLFPAHIAQAYVANDVQVMRDGSRLVVEEELPHVDGTTRTIETIKTCVRDADGKLVGTVGIARDITSRRLEEKERRLAAKAFESIAEGILVTDDKRNIVSVNKAACTITGYQPEELLGQQPSMLRSSRHDEAFYVAMWKGVDDTGFWHGEAWGKRKNGEEFPQLWSISAVVDEAGKTSHYVGACADISSLKLYEERLRYQAHHDALTALPNRFQFQERFKEMLARAERRSGQLAVMMLDLDRFKHINDSLGHAVGDQLLQQVSERLKSCLRQIDVISRFGGDEFALLLDDISSAASAARVAARLLNAFTAPFALSGHEIFMSSSIGISCYPTDATDAETLLKNADAAMYRAKAEGRNSYQYFTAELNTRTLENLLMSSSLRLALERNELLLHYQPRLDLGTGKISGAEALVRWQHPELGLLPPGRFIPVAEEMGLIEAVGDWVLREACRQTRRWRDAGLRLERVGVNLAARQFAQADFLSRVSAVLAECGIEACYLEFELTESMVMQRPERVVQVLKELKDMGISLAIDDFGTGYSSLSYLKRFPIDYLKIDRSFVKDIPENTEDVAITLAIIAMAKSLGLELIAEGVETQAQRDFLREKSCHHAQGYLFSKPVMPAELERMLRAESGA